MTTNKNTESNQGDGSIPSPPPPPAHPENQSSRGGNTVFKSGPLFISSKGIGWTSWKKRWFILTRTSLVFFRSDPNSIPQKGSEVNLTLGGIDLNNSGSVVVKADKKLLTVLFPDGRDGRAFTLKAETTEDLYEWKTALENALAQAPSTCLAMGQNGIFRSDQADGSSEQSKDKQPVKSVAIGGPILLALEDVDGSPSFLEKALRFTEDHGIKVEGILRQAADVDDVEHRIREYEQGKTEFSPGEDPHVIADCVKYFLRELPSSPVPASCCNALLEACRTDRGNRVNAMRVAICETFPEPNRRLLQRILMMMQNVASHKAENRMSTSAVAACMAPLLLRPLLAGECEIETNVNVGGDGSIQLLRAAAAANHAQAIIMTLLEEYDNIFSEGSMTPGLYSDSDEYGSEDEELTDDEYYEDDEQDYTTQGSDAYTDDDVQNESSGTGTESGDSGEGNLSDTKMQGCDDLGSGSRSPKVDNDLNIEQKLSPISVQTSIPLHDDEGWKNIPDKSNSSLATRKNDSGELLGSISEETMVENKQTSHNAAACIKKSTTISNGLMNERRGPHVWGRTSAKKNLSMESIDFSLEDEFEIQKLEASKIELQNRISEEVKGNAVLQANLEKRKKALHERRLALQQDVARLQEQLQKEREKRIFLESALDTSKGPLPVSVIIDEKMKAEIETTFEAEADVANLTKNLDDLDVQLNQQREQNYGSPHDSSHQPLHTSTHQVKRKDKQRDSEASVASRLGRSSSKDPCADINENEKKYESQSSPKQYPQKSQQLDVSERENEKKCESTSSPKEHMPINQQLDPAHSSCSRPTASASSKKAGSRSEGMNSASSALTKLTNRLNFLKERRSQIASELQNLDKGRGSGRALTNPDKGNGSELHQSLQNVVENHSSEVNSVLNPKSERGLGSSQSMQNPDKGLGTESSSLQNSEKIRKSRSDNSRT